MELMGGLIKVGGMGIRAANKKIRAHSPTYICFSSTCTPKREVNANVNPVPVRALKQPVPEKNVKL